MAALITTTAIGAPAVSTDKPAYLLYQQLRLQLQREVSEDISRYLAEPVFDSHQDEIDWYSTVDGSITSFSDLSELGQIEYIGQIEGIRRQLKRVGESYLKEGADPAKLTIGKALIAASGEPEKQYRYLVGDQPVVVFWGFIQKATDYPELLEKFIEIHHPPAKPPAPEVPPETIDAKEPKNEEKGTTHKIATSVPPPEYNAPPIEPFTLPPEEFDLLKYAGKVLWGGVFLALFFMVVLLLFKSVGLLSSQPGSSFPSAAEDDVLIDEIRQATASGEALQRELSGLQSSLSEKLCDCELGPIPQTSEDPPPSPEIEAVVESCDIANLVGRWQSRSNKLVNAISGEPVIVNYDFGVSGQGSIGITQADQSVCRGQAVAEFKETNAECVLHVSATGASCSATGSGYSSHEVECQLGDDGQAKCMLIQKNMKPVYAEFDRRSTQG